MKKIVLTFGLISGAVLSAMMVITLPFHDVIGNDRALILGYSTMVLAFLLVYFGVRQYRDTVGGGWVGFGRAMAVGSMIAFLASACYVGTWEVIYFGGKSDYIEKYQAAEMAKLRQKGLSEAELNAKQAEMQKFADMYKNPLFNSALTFLEPLPVALVFTLVSAGILSRRRKPAPQAA